MLSLLLLLLLLKTLGMLDAPTFQNGTDLKPTNQQPLISISSAWNRAQAAPA